MFQNDNIYSYEKLLQDVKELIFPTIVEMINPTDTIETGLNKEDLANIVYTQIMALVYNDEDINAAVNDLMPSRNPIIYMGPVATDAANMAMHLAMILEDYKHQVWAFKAFHRLTQALKPQKEIITEVKKHLLATQFGF